MFLSCKQISRIFCIALSYFFGRYVEGGMGSVSLAIGKAAMEAGAHIITRAEVFYWNLFGSAFDNFFFS